jgi:hypothetical protein
VDKRVHTMVDSPVGTLTLIAADGILSGLYIRNMSCPQASAARSMMLHMFVVPPAGSGPAFPPPESGVRSNTAGALTRRMSHVGTRSLWHVNGEWHGSQRRVCVPDGVLGGVLTGPRWGRAVVVGGAYAGLLTAHALAEHFERVTVCEQDLIDEDTEFHPGVPQARHPHAVLARGAELLEARFPELRAELAALDAPVYDVGLGVRYRLPTGRLPVSALGVEIQNVSRTTLERAICRRVLAHPRIELRGIRGRRSGSGQTSQELECQAAAFSACCGHAVASS